MKICIIGASGKLGIYMVQLALDRGYQVVGVCRERSVSKLEAFKRRITIIPGATNDRQVVQQAVAGCDGVLTVLVPWGNQQYSTGTAQAVLDYARPEARLIFSCGWHITRDGQDVYPQSLIREEKLARWLGRLTHIINIDDQVEACRRVFASNTRWTVVRGSDLEEGVSQGLPVWSRHVGDPMLASNLTRRVDYALFMVAALEDDSLVHEAPAIVGCRAPRRWPTPRLSGRIERNHAHKTIAAHFFVQPYRAAGFYLAGGCWAVRLRTFTSGGFRLQLDGKDHPAFRWPHPRIPGGWRPQRAACILLSRRARLAPRGATL